MAKKTRKTKKEKQTPKKHEFNPWVVPKSLASKVNTDSSTVGENKHQIPDYIYKDFKKITMIMGGFVFGLIILALISYHTEIFNSFFSIFHIKY